MLTIARWQRLAWAWETILEEVLEYERLTLDSWYAGISGGESSPKGLPQNLYHTSSP